MRHSHWRITDSSGCFELCHTTIFSLFICRFDPSFKIWQWHSQLATNVKFTPSLCFCLLCLVLCSPAVSSSDDSRCRCLQQSIASLSCEKFGCVFARTKDKITGKLEGLSECLCGKWNKHLTVYTHCSFLHSLTQSGDGEWWWFECPHMMRWNSYLITSVSQATWKSNQVTNSTICHPTFQIYCDNSSKISIKFSVCLYCVVWTVALWSTGRLLSW